MKKNIQQIRDINIIEKELNASPAGILALYKEDEKAMQVPATFLYMDKNIYLFPDENSAILNEVNYNKPASFAILRNDTPRKNAKEEISYRSISIIISGMLRNIDEQKIIDEAKQKYVQKYSKSAEENNESSVFKAVMIDTEEIQAIEETGS